MGKIFNALEKYKKERKVTSATERLKPADYETLLQYDRTTGKLDLMHSLFIKNPGVVERLITFRLIEADGSLTPAGKAKYAELNGHDSKTAPREPVRKPEEENSVIEQESVVGFSEIKASATETKDLKTPTPEPDFEIDMEQVVRKRLEPSDWNVLMHYGRANRRLDIESLDNGVAQRLLENKMIDDSGKLTPQALRFCKELKSDKIEPTDNIISDTGGLTAISQQPIIKKPVAEIKVAKAPGLHSTVVNKKQHVKKRPSLKPGMHLNDTKPMDQNLVALINPKSFEAEQFKILRSNLLYPVSGNPPRSVMVTSSLPGEGKSFVAANLAISVALNINRHVLLLDCDLRRPSIHTRFGFGDVPGLSDYLSSRLSLSDLLIRTSIDKLTILPGGEPPDNPSELLSSDRMSELLSEAVERYHDRFIIMDSPPPALTAETSVLARWVDGVIIVIKHGQTPRDGLLNVIEKIGKEKIVGAVINKMEMNSSRYYGKYYGSYYGKGGKQK